ASLKPSPSAGSSASWAGIDGAMTMRPIRKSIQSGMVLITTMLLLVVVTILALAMFRGAGLEQRIAGNTMEKQRALQAAVSSQQYGESWLASNVTSSPPVDCSA